MKKFTGFFTLKDEKIYLGDFMRFKDDEGDKMEGIIIFDNENGYHIKTQHEGFVSLLRLKNWSKNNKVDGEKVF